MSRFEFDPAGLAELIHPGGVVYDHVRAVAERVLTKAQDSCPVETGALRDSIEMSDQNLVDGVEFHVGSSLEATGGLTSSTPGTPSGILLLNILENGHGVIVSKTPGGRLLFRDESGHWVAPLSVDAVPGTHFMAHALDAATVDDDRAEWS